MGVKNRPNGYWNDFKNLKKELDAFMAKHGAKGVMPTQSELKAKKRTGLSHAISKHGGFIAVAKRLGLRRADTDKPSGFWDGFRNLEEELREFVVRNGIGGAMPTKRVLKSAGRSDLVHAIRKHGSFQAVADRLGLKYTNLDKLKGYWDDFANVEKELLAYIEKKGIDNRMPTNNELDAAGHSDLRGAIGRHGGFTQVAYRLGLTSRYTDKPKGYLNNFSNLERELHAFIAEHRLGNSMPTKEYLIKAGRSDLARAIGIHGGVPIVGEKLALNSRLYS